jgi:hypothetical protein
MVIVLYNLQFWTLTYFKAEKKRIAQSQPAVLFRRVFIIIWNQARARFQLYSRTQSIILPYFLFLSFVQRWRISPFNVMLVLPRFSNLSFSLAFLGSIYPIFWRREQMFQFYQRTLLTQTEQQCYSACVSWNVLSVSPILKISKTISKQELFWTILNYCGLFSTYRCRAKLFFLSKRLKTTAVQRTLLNII